MSELNYDDFYQVPELKFNISKVKRELGDNP